MKTVRRLLFRDIVGAVVFVTLAFLSLFFFIDLVDELGNVGKRGFALVHALASGLLSMPAHFYELFPIAVLIGTIFSMSRLAQSSEFTILRTGGLGPARALSLLSVLGIVFALVTIVVGDYLAPLATQHDVAMKAGLRGGSTVGRAGAWLKEHRQGDDGGERNVSINVQRVQPDGTLEDIRIYDFDDQGHLRERLSAARGRIEAGHWALQDAELTRWPPLAEPGALAGLPLDAAPPPGLQIERRPTLDWPTTLDPRVVAAAVLPTSTMSTIELWRYTRHLSSQEQATQGPAIQFWKRAFYPLACIVMVALALPFAYLHARSGGISFKVFGGILLGISFVLLNNIAGHLGVLRAWTPWIVAAAPSALYLLLSLGAFAWLVRYR
mgnify:CR=1 FL=1